MKVLHLTHGIDPYGISTFLLSLLSSMKEHGSFDLLGIALNKAHKYNKRFGEMRICVHNLRYNSAKNPGLLFSFIKLFKNYDIITLYSYSPWAFLAAIILKKKIVYTFHGAFGFRGRWTDYIKKNFYRSIINRFSEKMIFASKTSLEIYQNRIGCILPKKKIEIFPFGLQIESMKSPKAREEVRLDLGINNKFLIGTVARIDPAKRIERLIEAFSLLPKLEDFRLLVIGSGDISYRNYLLALVRQKKLEKFVSFLGYREDVLELVSAFDFFVLPSINETFGLALLEAMALGIPSAVFNDAGAAVDILGDNGLVANSIQELCDIILRIKKDSNIKVFVSHQMKERARLFDINFTAKKFRDIYQELN